MSTPTPPPSGDDQHHGQGTGWGDAPQVPSYGAPGPQAYGQYGAPDQGPVYAVAQPGIIPLRPLTMGEIYDGAFKAIRANPVVMFGLAAIVVAVVTIIQGALTWGLNEELFRLAGQVDPTAEDLDQLYGSLSASLLPSLVSSVVSFVVTTALNGILIHSISQSVIGRKLPLGELWKLVRPQLLKLLALTLLISVAAALAMIICFLPAIFAGMSGDLGLTIGLVLLGFVLAIAALLFVIVATVLATPVLVLERAGVLTSLRRSWQLTRTAFWRIAQLVGTVAAAAITTPFVAGVIALLYIDIRIRREGLDVELAAAAAEGA